MNIKQILITIIKNKQDADQHTLDVIISDVKSLWTVSNKQQITTKFNDHDFDVTPYVDFGLISTKNYYLRNVNNKYKLFVPPGDVNPFDVDFSILRLSENGDNKTMLIGIYYLSPNVYLDQIGIGTHKVNYTLQHTCKLAMKENRDIILKIDRYLYEEFQECISSLWRRGVVINANDQLPTPSPQERLITKLFNKL